MISYKIKQAWGYCDCEWTFAQISTNAEDAFFKDLLYDEIVFV
jgi:hypothetical protein